MTPHPLLAPFRPARYRELPRVRRPIAIGGAVLVLGLVPAAALGQRDARPLVPAAARAAAAVPAQASAPAIRRGSPSDAASPRWEALAERGVHRPGLRTPSVRPERASRTAARPAPPRPMRPRTVARVVFEQRGRASWYGPGFHGRRTASGERFDTGEMTAAHRTLPFGTRARVCTKRHCVNVRINDRGPFVAGRVVDLSRAAARSLGIEGSGVARVTVTVQRTTTVLEPVPAPVRPGPAVVKPAVVKPAAARRVTTRPPAAAAAVPAPAAIQTTLAGGQDGEVSAPAVAVVAAMVLLLWAAPTIATRRRREGLDFLR